MLCITSVGDAQVLLAKDSTCAGFQKLLARDICYAPPHFADSLCTAAKFPPSKDEGAQGLFCSCGRALSLGGLRVGQRGLRLYFEDHPRLRQPNYQASDDSHYL
jgi:hypothetical protein